MADRHAHLQSACPKCSSKIEAEQNWTAGGINDYGGWVLRCNSCGALFHLRLGRDINDSRVIHGATVVDAYDDELKNKDEILKKHGLSETE